MKLKFPVPKGEVSLSPSILSADFLCLEKSLKNAEKADWLHLDIMDGHFVNNLSFGPRILKSLKKMKSRVPVDAHLMVDYPEKFIKPFAEAGADLISFHIEAKSNISKCLKTAKSAGIGIGLVIKPKTPVSRVLKYLKSVDLLLIMSVEPGFGGQAFIKKSLAKIRTARTAIRKTGRGIWLQVDGGVNLKNAPAIVKAGADNLVMGNAFFNSSSQMEIIRTVKKLKIA